ncbi:MAG: mannosyltransferase family protein [Solirubrobacteraceae bacterium]
MRTAPAGVGPAAGASLRSAARRSVGALGAVRWTLGVYFATRLGCLLLAIVETFFRKWTLWGMLSNWDGIWYIRVLSEGYPSHVSHAQTPLGFLPLYPLLMWPLAHLGSLHPTNHAYEIAGLIVSLITGASATVLVGKLAESWWGKPASRRAVLVFCLFPGSIVFSMVYTEGLLLSLVAGCLLAMQCRRWLLAGILAGFSTAVGPPALAIVPACAAAAALHLRTCGWRNREAWRALLAPLLAPLGLACFGAYLWLHAGTPFASYQAQRYGWQESSSPLSLLHIAQALVKQIKAAPNWAHLTINTNYVAGLIGTVILLIALVLLLCSPRVPVPALVWTLGLMALTFTSGQTPPNARMLLIAFPAVIVFAQRVRGRWLAALLVLSGLLLVTMSWVSFVGIDLRP